MTDFKIYKIQVAFSDINFLKTWLGFPTNSTPTIKIQFSTKIGIPEKN